MNFSQALLFGALLAAVSGVFAGEPRSPSPGGVESRWEISINGKSWESALGSSPIFPGQANRLMISAKPSSATRPVAVSLVRTHADGRQHRATARLTPEAARVELELGLFAVPSEYDFEAGVVYRRATRFRLEVRDEKNATPPEVLDFYLSVDAANEREIVAIGTVDRVVHLGALPRPVRPLDPPIQLSISPEVLSDRDDVRIHYQLRPALENASAPAVAQRVPARLRVTAEKGADVVHEQPIEVAVAKAEAKLPVLNWKAGRYRIEIIPELRGVSDRDGPVIIYRRPDALPGDIALSPLAPWSFEIDSARPTRRITDFRAAAATSSATVPTHWQLRPIAAGVVRLITPSGNLQGEPLVLRPGVKGMYAVFATTEKGYCYLRVGREGLIRGLHGEPVFVDAADLTDNEIAIYPASVPGSGLRELRLVPVTARSVTQTLRVASQPPLALRAVTDWCDYFAAPPSHHSAGGRLAPDQLDTLLGAHAELGLRSITWSVGRSWVEYHSQLPNATRFPAVPLEKVSDEIRQTYAGRAYMINSADPLDHVLDQRERFGVSILPSLGMQRHYGTAYEGIFRSAWFRDNPQWGRWSKNARKPADSAVSYYYPEVRRERVDILCEVAARQPDGLMLDWCRQVPIILYDPPMVAEYRARTGVNPLEIDGSKQREYADWIKWRAEFVTATLRELRTRLDPIRQSTGRPLRVSVRVPSKGFFYNLAQGLDVETWCREGLIHEMQLDPLEDCAWRGEPHDVRPYVELGRTYGVPVSGGINGNMFTNYPAILRRALGLAQAGVTGIELYESNNFASVAPRRWLIPLLGQPELIRTFLINSNLDACFPIMSRNACSGYDNHSFRGNWSVYGTGPLSL